MRLKSGSVQTEDRGNLTIVPQGSTTVTLVDNGQGVDLTLGSALSRSELSLSAKGLISETFSLASGGGAGFVPVTTAANGTLQLTLLPLRAGDVVTNLICFMVASGTGLTLVKMALYDLSGSFLRATGESSASFNSGANAYRILPLTSPFTVLTSGGYYVGYLQIGTTGASIVRGNAAAGQAAAIGAGAATAKSLATQTDLAGNVTPVAANEVLWFAAS